MLSRIGLTYNDILRRTPREVAALCDDVFALTHRDDEDAGGHVPASL